MNLKKMISTMDSLSFNISKMEIKKYDVLWGIDEKESWKALEFYEGDQALLEKYEGMSFKNFIYDTVGITNNWYQSMKKLMKVKETRDVLKKYGRENAVTYSNSTAEEKKVILDYAETCKGKPSFSSIKCKFFPAKEKPIANIAEKEIERLKKELAAEKKENAMLKAEVQRLHDDIETMKKTINIISGGNTKKAAKKK